MYPLPANGTVKEVLVPGQIVTPEINTTSLYNYKYRCIATGANTITSSSRRLRFGTTWLVQANKQWSNAANWSCGAVPDANTDVIVPAGTLNLPVITSNVSCRSITASAGSTITVKQGV